MKKLVLLAMLLAMLLAAAGPALAQGETTKGDTTVIHIDCAPGYELVKGDDPSGKEDKCVPKTPEDNSNNGGAAGGAKNLPATGGALPITGLLGALLVGGGLLVRRIVR